MTKITWIHPYTSKLDNMKKGQVETILVTDEQAKQIMSTRYGKKYVVKAEKA